MGTRTDNERRGLTRFEEIKRNKEAYKGGLHRFDMFCERMVNKDKPDAISDRYFSPSEDFSIIINKRVDVAPTNFSIIGDSDEDKIFLKKYLWEHSKIESKLPRSYREQDLAGDSFWEVKNLAADKDVKHMYQFEINQLETEYVTPSVDPITRKLECIVVEERRRVADDEGNYHSFHIKKKYYEKEIKYEYINVDSSFLSKLFGTNIRKKSEPNPFYGTGFLGILWFKGEEKGDDYTSVCSASDLIEPQLQLDKNWTQHEMAIHRGIFPIIEFTKANRASYDKIYLGAGAVVASNGLQEMKIHAPSLMITEMLAHIRQKEEKIYFKGGVLPPVVEEKIFATDSLGIAKFANKQLIGVIETRLQSYKDEMSKLFKAFMILNGKKYNGESIKLPDDILKVDLEKAASVYSILMNLGIVDDEFVWTELFPDFQEKEKIRIRENFKEKFGTIDQSNLNLDNKVKAAGNKAQATKNVTGKVVSDG